VIVRSSFRGSLETGTHGGVRPRVYTLHVSAVTSSWEQHSHITDGRNVEEVEKEEEKEAVAIQYVTAARKFAIPTCVRGTCRAGLTRVRGGSSPPCFLVYSSLRERNLLQKCRYVDEGGSTTIASSLSSRPLVARRVNIRLGDSRLDCVHCKSIVGNFFTKISLRVRAVSVI